MKIKLRLQCQSDATAALTRDPVVAGICDLDATVFELDSESEVLDRVLALTKATSGIWFNPVMSFAPAELAGVRYFQLECRGKLLRETDRDYELNSSRLKELEFIHTGDRLKIKLPARIALSKISLKPNMIAGASDWMAEFIVTEAVASIFDKAGLTGLSLRPIFNTKAGTDYDSYFQLYSENIMPPAEIDLTTPPFEDPTEGGFRQLACLTYDLSGEETICDLCASLRALRLCVNLLFDSSSESHSAGAILCRDRRTV